MLRACSTNVEKRWVAGTDHEEDQDVGGWILERQDCFLWTGYVWLRIGTSGGEVR
jgi:hypothetical protein